MFGEEDEEEYRARYSGLSQRAALEMVDPGGLDDLEVQRLPQGSNPFSRPVV